MSRLRLAGTGVAKRFGRVAALAGIDFEIEPGESVAILGANGAGKSTWLRILAGLAKPSDGRFVAELAEGSARTALSREQLRGRVGYVGHATLLSGELTARENLVFAARLHGRRPSRAEQDALLAELGLAELADRRVSTLSRGTAQRVSIARGVVHEPDVLLLDEPFTGLDEVAAARLSRQLSRLRARGCSLVVITHDPQRAVELADRALLLHRGRLRGATRRSEGEAFGAPALRDALVRLAREDEANAEAGAGRGAGERDGAGRERDTNGDRGERAGTPERGA
ncbi:MAG: ABC transporter ATP-binding protein [Deltaproteobacteria bacterium]|nr:ABC transporter ATP-binding protein [Deltaproteobacteria bacterium]